MRFIIKGRWGGGVSDACWCNTIVIYRPTVTTPVFHRWERTSAKNVSILKLIYKEKLEINCELQIIMLQNLKLKGCQIEQIEWLGYQPPTTACTAKKGNSRGCCANRMCTVRKKACAIEPAINNSAHIYSAAQRTELLLTGVRVTLIISVTIWFLLSTAQSLW